jgi:hypothetical protein
MLALSRGDKETRMKIYGLGILIGAAGLAMSGCATVNSPEAYANAAANKEECKAVAVYSTHQELHTQLDTGVPPTDGVPKTALAKEDGVQGTMQVNANPPPSLRTPLGRLNSTTGRLLLDC